MSKKLNVVNHTHWDREWYESYETYRGKLLEAIDLILDALDRGQFEYFMLDGQTVVLEDLKEVLEQSKMERVEKYIREGKIDIGPWYVLPDEFLVSGESLIRNLQRGIEISKEYGREDFVGYLPDTFGHIGQLPQIFKGLGIKWALLFRGVISNKSEEYFLGSDGTRIKTLVLPLRTGYYNHFLSYKEYEEEFRKFIKDIEKYSTNGDMLLLNGADHLIPCENLKDRLDILSEKMKLEIKQTNLIKYTENLDKVELLEEIVGEQRDGSKAFILTNVLSTRTYLKKQNQEVEDEITLVTEPMELIKSICNGEYKHKMLDHSWKTLLKNHPHDSICGCSIDKVHKEMEVRNSKLVDMLKSIEYFAAKHVISWKAIDNKKLYVFNPHPYKYKIPIDVTLELPIEVNWFNILDKNGNIVDMVIHSKEKKNTFKADVDLEPSWYEVNEFKVSFLGEFNSIGYKEYHIENTITNTINSMLESKLENKFIKVEIGIDGYINIKNKITGKEYNGMNQIVSSIDSGDEYTYSPPIFDKLSRARIKNIDYIKSNSLYQEMVINYVLLQPSGLSGDRKSLEGEIESTIEVRVKLINDSCSLYFETKVNNNAKDQRLRVVFPVGKRVYEYFTDVSFDVVKRTPLVNSSYYVDKMKEMKVNTFPTDSYVKVPKEFSLLHIGLQECEVGVYGKENDGVYLTLLRGVGWLSRDDMSTRGGNAGPMFKTPDAQCLGEHIFKYGITFEENPAYEARIMRISPNVILGNEIKEGLEDILSIDNKKVLVSAFYKDNKENTVLRVFNTGCSNEEVNISSLWKEYNVVDLLGKNINIESNKLVLKPLQIVTIFLKEFS